MTLKSVLMATAFTLLPALALAQTDTAGAATATRDNGPAETVLSEADTMNYFAQMLCDKNPYVEQENKTTGESTGPMMIRAGDAPQVLADNYGKPYTVAGKTFYIRRVVSHPYEFATYRSGKFIGLRQEYILMLYAGSEGGG